jgi:hypothetical protein
VVLRKNRDIWTEIGQSLDVIRFRGEEGFERISDREELECLWEKIGAPLWWENLDRFWGTNSSVYGG